MTQLLESPTPERDAVRLAQWRVTRAKRDMERHRGEYGKSVLYSKLENAQSQLAYAQERYDAT